MYLKNNLVLDPLGVHQIPAVEHAPAVREKRDGLTQAKHNAANVRSPFDLGVRLLEFGGVGSD